MRYGRGQAGDEVVQFATGMEVLTLYHAHLLEDEDRQQQRTTVGLRGLPVREGYRGKSRRKELEGLRVVTADL